MSARRAIALAVLSSAAWMLILAYRALNPTPEEIVEAFRDGVERCYEVLRTQSTAPLADQWRLWQETGPTDPSWLAAMVQAEHFTSASPLLFISHIIRADGTQNCDVQSLAAGLPDTEETHVLFWQSAISWFSDAKPGRASRSKARIIPATVIAPAVTADCLEDGARIVVLLWLMVMSNESLEVTISLHYTPAPNTLCPQAGSI